MGGGGSWGSTLGIELSGIGGKRRWGGKNRGDEEKEDKEDEEGRRKEEEEKEEGRRREIEQPQPELAEN